MKSKEKALSNRELRKLQLEQISILKEFIRICDMNDIPYFAVGGTMLGAVRHKNFIPWDDDIDVGMLRKDYERFCQICDSVIDKEKFFFQTWDTDVYYRCQYGRMRKNNTLYVRSGHENAEHHNGINIDVFPVDRVPSNIILCIIYKTGCEFYRKALYSPVGYQREKNPIYKQLYNILRHISYKGIKEGFSNWIKFFGRFYSERSDSVGFAYRLSLKEIKKLGWDNYREMYLGMSTQTYEKLQDYEFEGMKIKGVKDYDYYLKTLYGDYMKLPPIEKRSGEHRAVEVKFSEEY